MKPGIVGEVLVLIVAGIWIFVFGMFAAQSAERALMLDDNDVKVLTQILDAATRSGGIQIAPATVYILDKLNKAPVVTERKDIPPNEETKP